MGSDNKEVSYKMSSDFTIQKPFNRYDIKLLFKAFKFDDKNGDKKIKGTKEGYQKEKYGVQTDKNGDGIITEPELRSCLSNDEDLKKLLSSEEGRRAIARAIYALIKGCADPRERSQIGTLLILYIISNKNIKIPASIRLLAMEYYKQATDDVDTKKHLVYLEKKKHIATANASAEAQALHNHVVEYFDNIQLKSARYSKKTQVNPRVAEFLKEIYSKSGGNIKTTQIYPGAMFSVVHYENSEYYGIYKKTGELFTIIPSTKPVEVSAKTLVAYYPFNFKVSFENFEKTIDRNNWCINWLYKMPKAFFGKLKLLSFSDKEDRDKSGVYNSILDRITIYWDVSAGSPIIPHELCHYWHIAVAGKDEQKLFAKISWDNDGEHRIDSDINDFFGPTVGPCDKKEEEDCAPGKGIDITRVNHLYGMTNQYEDFAALGEYYIVMGAWARNKVRRHMKRGNFELAVKYLFFKHISPVAGEEFGVSAQSPSITIDEVKKAMEDYLVQHPGKIRKSTSESFDGIVVRSLSIPKVPSKTFNPVSGLFVTKFPSIEEQFNQSYPNIKQILLDKNRLDELGLTKNDLNDQVNGWKKLSEALYEDDGFLNELKKLNGNRSCPARAYISDFYLNGEVVKVRSK